MTPRSGLLAALPILSVALLGSAVGLAERPSSTEATTPALPADWRVLTDDTGLVTVAAPMAWIDVYTSPQAANRNPMIVASEDHSRFMAWEGASGLQLIGVAAETDLTAVFGAYHSTLQECDGEEPVRQPFSNGNLTGEQITMDCGDGRVAYELAANSPANPAMTLFLRADLPAGDDATWQAIVASAGFAGTGIAQGMPATTRPPTAGERLAAVPIFDSADGVAVGDCVLPEWQQTPDAVGAFTSAAIDCFDAAWRPLLTAHGEPGLIRPAVLPTPRGQNVSFCADATGHVRDPNGYYCVFDYTIYLADDLASLGQTEFLSTLAHEYAHHIQNTISVDELSTVAWFGSPAYSYDAAQALEIIRRIELQAECFVGLFVGSHVGRGSISQQLFDELLSSANNAIGDDAHGSAEAIARWFGAGVAANQLSVCDTFSAPADQVAFP